MAQRDQFWTRKNVCVLFVALVACGRVSSTNEPQMPTEIEGGYRLSSIQPDGENRWNATYAGPVKVIVAVEKTSAAFERVQKFKSEQGKLATYKNNWFIVIDAPALDPMALNQFAARLEKAIGTVR
jgi:hypothetical protein